MAPHQWKQRPDKRLDGAPPNWAKATNVIGYTYHDELSVGLVEQMINAAPGEFKGNAWTKSVEAQRGRLLEFMPSIYYKQGHVTLKHNDLGDLGWTKSDTWIWLYFGNVPENDYYLFTEDQPPKDLRHRRIQLADRLRQTHGSYCSSDGRTTDWKVYDPASSRSFKSLTLGRILAEVWIETPDTNVWNKQKSSVAKANPSRHPSRNPFRWDNTPRLTFWLNKLAHEWLKMLEPARAKI
jgi:hypothetical protein